VQHGGEAEVEVEMQQDLRLHSQHLLGSDAHALVAAGEHFHLRHCDLLVLGRHEEGRDGLQGLAVPVELGGEDHAVVDVEGEEDRFRLEAVPNAEAVDQIEVANAGLVVEAATVQEERQGEAGLLPEEVLTYAANIRTGIAGLAHLILQSNALSLLVGQGGRGAGRT
jgi:hypothetical protein